MFYFRVITTSKQGRENDIEISNLDVRLLVLCYTRVAGVGFAGCIPVDVGKLRTEGMRVECLCTAERNDYTVVLVLTCADAGVK
jgi:hypothetical protein